MDATKGEFSECLKIASILVTTFVKNQLIFRLNIQGIACQN